MLFLYSVSPFTHFLFFLPPTLISFTSTESLKLLLYKGFVISSSKTQWTIHRIHLLELLTFNTMDPSHLFDFLYLTSGLPHSSEPCTLFLLLHWWLLFRLLLRFLLLLFMYLFSFTSSKNYCQTTLVGPETLVL